jgi:hypothetical protein
MEMIYYYITLLFALSIFLYYKWHNDYSRIERYYFKEDKKKYYALKVAYLIIVMAIVINTRFIIYRYAAVLHENLKKRLKN